MATKRKVKEDKPVFIKMLDCSTAHITQADAAFFALDCDAPLRNRIICDEFPFGFYVYVQPLAEMRNLPLSKGFRAVMAFARKVGAKYVKFDCDGETYSQLKVYDW